MKIKGKVLTIFVTGMLITQTMSFNAMAANTKEVDPPTAWGPTPSETQLQYHEEELAAFIHFGVNTFTNSEWGNGKENPNVFNPTNLDTDQWVKTLKDAGFKRIIMIGRHHDGFCLWQSEHTDHDVENSTDWQNSQNGEGDVMLALSKSCTKYDMDMGLYLSPWDANNESYGYGSGNDDATDTNGDYNEYYMNQLEEVLGNPKYGNNGKFVEVWMDGAKGTGAAAQKYKFQEWFDLIEELQPGALVFSPYGSTIRWVGNESGLAGDPCWSKIEQGRMQYAYDHGYEEAGYLNSGDPNGDVWSIGEADVSIESGWFWHNGNKPKSMEQLTNIYFKSVGRGQPLLLNMPPDTSGQLPKEDVERVTELGNAIKSTFKRDLAKESGVSATSSSIRGDDISYEANNVVDDDADSYWTMDDGQKTGSLTVNLGGFKYFDVVSIEEYIKLGQRISDFNIEVHTANGWQEFDAGHTIGAKRLSRHSPVSADQVRINITGSQAVPIIENVGVFKADKQFELPKLYPDGVKTNDNTAFINKDAWNQEALGDNNTSMYSSTTGTYAEATFTGSKAWIYGTQDPNHGIMEVWIDGKKVADADTYAKTRKLPGLLYTTDDLEYGEHTIKMVVKGEKNAASKGNAVGLDFLAYLDNNGAGMFEMAQNDYTVDEGGSVDVTINRIGGSIGEASVHFATSPDTAVHGRHYKDVSQDVVFADGQTQAIVTVETIDNTEIADNLRFMAQLDDPKNNALLGFNITSSVVIRDNDGKGRLENALKEADGKIADHYTNASWMPFLEAYEQAKAVMDDETADQIAVDNAAKALEEATKGLVKRGVYTIADPLKFPNIVGDNVVTAEAEFFTLAPTTPLDKHVRVEDAANASNGQMVTWFENGDEIKVPYVANKKGTYTVTATYYSGRASANPNKFNWKGDNIKAGSVSVFGPNASEAKKVTFDIEIEKAGPGELIFFADASSCPNTDKFEIKAKDVEMNTYTINAKASAGGRVEKESNVVTEGDSVTLKAVADTGYHFVNWTKDGVEVSTDADYTFTPTQDGTYTANFMIDQTENVGKQILLNLIAKVESKEVQDKLIGLAPPVKEAIDTRLQEAKDVAARVASDSEYLNAWLNLANALHYLDFEADKEGLHTLLAECKDIVDNIDSYVSGVEEFLAAYEEAKATSEDDNALNERINAVCLRLINAKNALVKGDSSYKEILADVVAKINASVGDEKAYTPNSWQTLAAALAKAEAVLANEFATQQEYVDAIKLLTSAYEDLRLMPDEALLQTLKDFIQKVDSLDLRLYAPKDVASILNLRNRSLLMLEDLDNFDLTAYSALNADIIAMQDVIEQGQITDEKNPTPSIDEATPNDPQTPVDNVKPVVQAPVKTQGTTKTGDTSNMPLAAGMAAMAMGVITFMTRKRRHK